MVLLIEGIETREHAAEHNAHLLICCSRLHKLRPNTGAVFHTHQPEISSLACLEGFRCVDYVLHSHYNQKYKCLM